MFNDILNLIKENDSIVLFGHVNPDGDCYSALTGMRELIYHNFKDKKVYISSSGVKKLFPLFGETDTSVSSDIIRESLGIVLDCRDTYMIEDQRYKECSSLANIDHHISSETNLAGPYISDPKACSTCELITDFIKETGLKTNKKISTMLLNGILSDTGRFQYADDYGRMFDTVSYLVKQGADIKHLYKAQNLKDGKDLSIRSYIYSHYETSEHGVIYIVFTKNDLKNLQVTLNEAASYVNTLGWIENYPIWIGFYEYPNHHMRAEFRSQTIPVEPIACSLGGGGHEFASGCTNLDNFSRKVIDDIVSLYDNEILKNRK